MAGAAVALALIADDPASRGAAEALFPDVERQLLAGSDLRPVRAFYGLLFELLRATRRGSCVGLVVPVVWAGSVGPESQKPEVPADGDVVAVTDHVNLELRGPLTCRWPDGVPRDFPSMTGIYQPGVVRARAGARVYSSGVVAAGVADARRLTRFESRVVRAGGLHVVCDSLVPAAIVAAYYGLRLAACGVVQAPARDRE
jgi:hypothetical protein